MSFFAAFFSGIPFPVQFFLAFVIVLGLIGAAMLLVHRLGGGRLGGGALRSRQRLAVVDYASVDGRRRLILVRRDNVEHLVMIGGPTDIVVEANIVRASAGGPRVPATIDPQRAIAMPDGTTANAAADGSASATWPKPALRLQRNPFAPNPRSQPAMLRQEAPRENQQDGRQEPRLAAPQGAPGAPSTDLALAEMARELEAVLRKPAKADRSDAREGRPAPILPRPATPPTQGATAAAAMALSAPRAIRANAAANAANGANSSAKPHYDSLDQEMASLLGRSGAK